VAAPQPPPRIAQHRHHYRVVAVGYAAVDSNMPPLDAARGIAQYLPLHSLLEMIAIVIAMMVFAISWNTYSPKLPANIVFLGSVFLGVGLPDFSHTLSYAGMPDSEKMVRD